MNTHRLVPDLSRARWIKSSYSGGANDCVEIAEAGPHIALRDSKDPQLLPLILRPAQLRALVQSVKDGSLGA